MPQAAPGGQSDPPRLTAFGLKRTQPEHGLLTLVSPFGRRETNRRVTPRAPV